MIGASQSLKPSQSAYRPSPVSALSGISPLRTLADKTTVDAKNNAYAAGLNKGDTEAQNYLDQQMGRGVSRTAKDEMFAGQRRAAGAAEGAMDAASVEAADQAFNAQQRFGQKNMGMERMLNNYTQASQVQNSNWQNRFSINQTMANNQMQRAQGSQSLWLSLLGSLG